MLLETETVPLLEKHSNLYCEIGPQFRVEAERVIERENQPDWLRRRLKGWQRAAEKYPSRLIWGSDVFARDDIRRHRYDRFVAVWQRFCEPVDRPTQERIAYRNLVELLSKGGRSV